MIGVLQNKSLKFKINRIKIDYWNKIQIILNGRRKSDVSCKLRIGKIDYDFKDVVLCDFGELENFASLVSKNKSAKLISTYKGKRIRIKLKKCYEKFRKDCGAWLVDELELTVCPYCNREFLNINKNKTAAEFDHLFPKDKYECLSLCISNLIPCCHTCNHLKSNNNLVIYSPYNPLLMTDDLCHFEFDIFENIYLKADSKLFKSNISIFHLDERYKIHSNIIKHYREKALLLNQQYCNFLDEITNKNNLNLIDAVFDISDNTNYYLRPLSKFETDICKQLLSDLGESLE